MPAAEMPVSKVYGAGEEMGVTWEEDSTVTDRGRVSKTVRRPNEPGAEGELRGAVR